MKMKLLFHPGFLLLLIVNQNQGRARPIASLQPQLKLTLKRDHDSRNPESLSKLLDEDLERPLVSEERNHEQDDMIPRGTFEEQDTEFQWTQSTRDQPESMSMGDGAVQRFFSDLLGLRRRYRSRSKKGLSRGCFGVKLDRIGSLSGLGC